MKKKIFAPINIIRTDQSELIFVNQIGLASKRFKELQEKHIKKYLNTPDKVV